MLRDRALLEFLYGTGARISEATGLDVDDLDHLIRDPAVLLTGKGGKQRYVPVGSYAVRALDAYLVRGRPALAREGERGRRARRSSSTPAAAGSPGRARGGSCAKRPHVPASPMFPLIRCGTPSPRTCSTAARTSASCRSCSDMPR